MKTVTTFIAHPTTFEQVAASKAFAKTPKIKFKVKDQNDLALVKAVLQGDEDFKRGNFQIVATETLWD